MSTEAEHQPTAPVDVPSEAAEVLHTDRAIAQQQTDTSGLAGLYVRFRHQIHELGKFVAVGGVSFVVDTIIFNWLRASLGPLPAGTISMIVAATIAFVGNRFWTWRDRDRTSLRREYALYFIFNAIGLLIAITCLAISHYGLGSIWPAFTGKLADNVSKQLVGTALGTIFRFWSYRTVVFRDKT